MIERNPRISGSTCQAASAAKPLDEFATDLVATDVDEIERSIPVAFLTLAAAVSLQRFPFRGGQA